MLIFFLLTAQGNDVSKQPLMKQDILTQFHADVKYALILYYISEITLKLI